MACRTGKLPQWWLDSAPHDTLEEQVERRAKEAEERRAQEQQTDAVEECADDVLYDTEDAAAQKEAPMEALEMNGKVNGDAKTSSVSRTNGYKRNSNPRSPLLRPPDEYESTDYKVERAKLRHVSENGKKNINNKRNGVLSPSMSDISATSSPSTWSSDVDSPQGQSILFESTPSDEVLSPESTPSTPSSLTSIKKASVTFKTTFTGVSPFDFAMQQRAREQERRQKERLARENLRDHHAAKVQKDSASQQKQKDLEEKRKKKEAEDALKKFRKTSLESDLETELTRRRQEDKRKKKEAEEQHHIYKATS